MLMHSSPFVMIGSVPLLWAAVTANLISAEASASTLSGLLPCEERSSGGRDPTTACLERLLGLVRPTGSRDQASAKLDVVDRGHLLQGPRGIPADPSNAMSAGDAPLLKGLLLEDYGVAGIGGERSTYELPFLFE